MTAKQRLFRLAEASGAFSLVRDSAWRRRRLMILCYHGISMHDEHRWKPELYMSPATFRRRLERLRAGRYNVLRLGDAVRRLYDGTLPPRAVALTFDDGAVDFAERAVPLLREFDVPATVYLTTYYAERRMPVFSTAVAYTLWAGRGSGADVAGAIGHPAPLLVGDAAARQATAAAVRDAVAASEMSADAQNDLLRDIAERVGVDFGALLARRTLQIMTPDEVRALPRDLVDVELHTHRHRTPHDEALFRREIDDNRRRIVALLGPLGDGETDAPAHFCYPSGHYYGEFLPWLRAEGVVSATTCLPALASPSDEPLLLPRFVDADTQPDAVFEAWVSGFAQLLPQRRAYRLDPARL